MSGCGVSGCGVSGCWLVVEFLAVLGGLMAGGVVVVGGAVLAIALADNVSMRLTGHGVLADPLTGKRHVRRQPDPPSPLGDVDAEFARVVTSIDRAARRSRK